MNADEIGQAILKAGYRTQSKKIVGLLREALARTPRGREGVTGDVHR